MLLSGYLDREKFILPDRRTAPATFFLFAEREKIMGIRKILPT
jgi:hypothetical protein